MVTAHRVGHEVRRTFRPTPCLEKFSQNNLADKCVIYRCIDSGRSPQSGSGEKRLRHLPLVLESRASLAQIVASDIDEDPATCLVPVHPQDLAKSLSHRHRLTGQYSIRTCSHIQHVQYKGVPPPPLFRRGFGPKNTCRHANHGIIRLTLECREAIYRISATIPVASAHDDPILTGLGLGRPVHLHR